MNIRRKIPYADWLLGGVMFMLCAGLTVLQYRWTGEVARAESERLRGGLDAAAASFAKTFDDTLADYCTALVPAEGSVNDADRAEVHLEQFQKWHALRPWPVFRRIGVAVQSADDVKLFEQSQSSGALSPVAWPPEWETLRQHFENGGGPFVSKGGLLIEFPVFGSGGPPESEWVVLELDTNYLQSVWLPKLVADYLNIGGQPVSRVVIKTIAMPSQTIFSTSGKAGGLSRPVTIRLNRQGRSLDSGPGPAPNYRWLLEVYPQPDALEKLVAASRRKNFAVAVALNLLMLATGIALVHHTRRSRKLAEQQMNFVANVSHELRTPLTVIRGAAHNMRRGVVSEPGQIQKYAGLIIEYCEQLSEMVEQVLAQAGAQKRISAALHEPVTLAEVLHDAVTATAHDTQATQCDVQLELAPVLPPVLGDAAALRRVFQNLITNAAKHAGSGKWIGVTAVSDEDSHPPVVEIQVADRGPGIPANELADIFKPFFRGALTQALQIRGSGLGLSLVKEIVEAHGGTISVRSINGHGATFIVRLPAVQSEKTK